MKHYVRLFWLALLLAAIPLTPGATCKTSVQTTTYNSLASTETTVSAAYSAYLDSVLKGQTSTNSVPQVSKVYNDVQTAITAAIAAAQYNPTNPAPQNVLDLANSLANLINQVKGH